MIAIWPIGVLLHLWSNYNIQPRFTDTEQIIPKDKTMHVSKNISRQWKSLHYKKARKPSGPEVNNDSKKTKITPNDQKLSKPPYAKEEAHGNIDEADDKKTNESWSSLKIWSSCHLDFWLSWIFLYKSFLPGAIYLCLRNRVYSTLFVLQQLESWYPVLRNWSMLFFNYFSKSNM